jgi:hypothetical protein
LIDVLVFLATTELDKADVNKNGRLNSEEVIAFLRETLGDSCTPQDEQVVLAAASAEASARTLEL